MQPLVSQPFTPASEGLACDGVLVESIVERVGTPVYIYSARAIREAYGDIDRAFAAYPHAIHYALKANSTLAIVRLLRTLGSKVDANSGGEIAVARRAGVPMADVVFTGVGKTRDELASAIVDRIGVINAESAGELDRIAELATAHGVDARVALRVNPDIDAGSHPKISTGLRINKFGVPLHEAREVYRTRLGRAGLRFVGVHVHIGSQITSVEPLRRAAQTVATLALELRDDGVALEHVDIGGGLGISYDQEQAIGVAEYAAVVIPELQRCGIPVVLEPGRVIVGRAGAMVATVVDIKRFGVDRQFAVLDAGMAELLRPALYGAYHRIVPLRRRTGAETPWDVVGPICESSDVFAQERPLPPLEVRDRVALLDAGAYGSAMASNYNRHQLPPEVLVDGDRWTVIRRRQSIDDMLALES
jgi:diaminopimelate decarboxylase